MTFQKEMDKMTSYGLIIYKRWWYIMAKPTTIEIKLESTAGTGTFYVTKKNPRTKTEKMKVRKYDKKTRKHEEFVEKKIK